MRKRRRRKNRENNDKSNKKAQNDINEIQQWAHNSISCLFTGIDMPSAMSNISNMQSL